MVQLKDVPIPAQLAPVVRRLEEIGVRTVRDLLLADQAVLVLRSELTAIDIDEFLAYAVTQCSAHTSSGRAILDRERNAAFFLPTGCGGLDEILDGGLSLGEIMEFAGPPASGKTQVALFTAITTVADDPRATVLYIDSGGAFTSGRVQRILRGSDKFVNATRTSSEGDWLSRIHHLPCYDTFTLADILESVHERLKVGTDEFTSRLRLIIIDSVGGLLSAIVGSGQPHAYVAMMAVSQVLKEIALTKPIATLLINYAVSSDFRDTSGQPLSNASFNRTKPALGASWSYIPSVRLYFTGPDEEWTSGARADGHASTYTNRNGVQVPVVERNIEILSSHRTPSGRSCLLYIGGDEVLSYPRQQLKGRHSTR
ncbi:DNA repair protein rad51d [Gaertneriomyces sp. JEL0708]|nr:DNA repair protein rad51d [Gaertneriomyces sp. JEL0708]